MVSLVTIVIWLKNEHTFPITRSCADYTCVEENVDWYCNMCQEVNVPAKKNCLAQQNSQVQVSYLFNIDIK